MQYVHQFVKVVRLIQVGRSHLLDTLIDDIMTRDHLSLLEKKFARIDHHLQVQAFTLFGRKKKSHNVFEILKVF